MWSTVEELFINLENVLLLDLWFQMYCESNAEFKSESGLIFILDGFEIHWHFWEQVLLP